MEKRFKKHWNSTRAGKFAKQALNAGRECGRRTFTHNVSFTHATRSRIRLWEFLIFVRNAFHTTAGKYMLADCNEAFLNDRSIEMASDWLNHCRTTCNSVFARFALKTHWESFLPRILNPLESNAQIHGTGSVWTGGFRDERDLSMEFQYLKISKFYDPRYPWILRFKCFEPFDTVLSRLSHVDG